MIASDTQVALDRALAAWRYGGGSFLFGAPTSPLFVDLTGPTVTSITVAANGTDIDVLFSEAVTGGTGCTLTLGATNPLTYASGSGTNTLRFSPAWPVGQSTVPTFNYSGGDIQDIAGNDLATISGQAVTNNSTTWTPQTLGAFLTGWFYSGYGYESTAGGGGGTPVAGAACGRWLDLSGNSRHLDAPSAGARPTRAADGRGVTGNATDQTMASPSSLIAAYGSAGFCYFWKWKRASADANTNAAVGYAAANDSRWGGFGGSGAGGFFGGSSVTVVTPADTNENVVGLSCNVSAALTVSTYDGSYTATGNVHFTASAVGIQLLSRNNTSLFSGDTVIEFLAVNSESDASMRSNIRTWLAGV